VKFVVLTAVPVGVTTVIGPLEAPSGTVVEIWVPCWFTVNGVADVPPNVTWVAPVRPVPTIVTAVPSVPLVGEKEVITGPPVTVKLVALVAVPLGFVTVIGPVVADVGTVVVICVELFTVNVADVPLNATAVEPVKFVPVMTTLVPTEPLVGVKEVIVGEPAAVTVKLLALEAVPPGVVTMIFPVMAPVGTTAVIWVAELTVKFVAEVFLNVTSVAPVRFVPVMTTDVPTGPLIGTNEVIVGAPEVAVVTSKLAELVAVPPGVVTRT